MCTALSIPFMWSEDTVAMHLKVGTGGPEMHACEKSAHSLVQCFS